MNYSEAVEFLYSLRFFGAKLGLENTLRLASLCGDPHQSLRFIHVAGTNGKGSTCAILESIYRSAGLKTGLFTSPHLVSFTERIQVNRQPINEDEVVRMTSDLLRLITRENGGKPRDQWDFRPTFFEVVAVMALLCFRQHRCELVLWETGLGGRLDATNIVTPLAAIITNIQADHQQWLGTSIAEIAGEKGGIIKPGIPIVTAANNPEALPVLEEISHTRGAPFYQVGLGDFAALCQALELSMPGQHQKLNAACALKVVDILQPLIPVPPAAITRGLKEVRWAGRLQLIRNGNRNILLDGAHNPDGAQALATALRQQFGESEITLVVGFLQDKDWRRMCQVLVPIAKRVILVPMHSERALPPAEIQEYCRHMQFGTDVDSSPSVAAALEAAPTDGLTVVAGSLHLVGEAMEHLGMNSHGRSERALNEWNAANEPHLKKDGV